MPLFCRQSTILCRKILFQSWGCSLLCTFRCKQFELITERRPGKLLSVAMDRTSSHVLHVWKDSLSKANPPGKKKQEWSFLTFEMRQGIDICPGPKKTELCTKCDFRAKICKERFSSDFVFRSSIFTTHWECSICVRGCILAAAAQLSKTNCDFWV